MIFLDIKNRLKFIYLDSNILDEGSLLKFESDSNIFLPISIYKDNEVQSLLGFIDKDILAEIAWSAISKKVMNIEFV